MSQACQVTVVSQDEAPHAGTLRPRLCSSSGLIGSLILDLEPGARAVAEANEDLLRDGETGPFEAGLAAERLAFQAVAALEGIRSRILGISSLSEIPAALAPAIPAIRALSSGLFELMPACSHGLCELSARLGSIVVDSAILTRASCDFGLSNAESDRLLNEAGLAADREMGRRHPDLADMPGGSHA